MPLLEYFLVPKFLDTVSWHCGLSPKVATFYFDIYFYTFLNLGGIFMDFKKIMQDYFGIALAVVIGVAVVTMYSSFMVEGGLIQGFTQDILNIVIEKVKTMIQ